jgi:hypothetical protein
MRPSNLADWPRLMGNSERPKPFVSDIQRPRSTSPHPLARVSIFSRINMNELEIMEEGREGPHHATLSGRPLAPQATQNYDKIEALA